MSPRKPAKKSPKPRTYAGARHAVVKPASTNNGFVVEKANKGLVEKGVALDWIGATRQNLCNLRLSSSDPPDCVAEDNLGNKVGIEVTELIDECMVKFVQGLPQDWWLTYEVRMNALSHVKQALGKIIQEKDSKNYKDGPYKRLVLVVHANERLIEFFQDWRQQLEAATFPATKQITEAYLLLSYNPQTQTYPCVRLPLCGHA